MDEKDTQNNMKQNIEPQQPKEIDQSQQSEPQQPKEVDQSQQSEPQQPQQSQLETEESSNKKSKKSNTDANGFPLPKCRNMLDLLTGKCLATSSKPVKVIDATSEISENIMNAILHFAATTGAVGVNKILDLLFFTVFGIDNINNANKESVFKQLEAKTKFIQELTSDPDAQDLIKKLSASLGLIILEGTEAAREPLLKAFNNIIKSSFEGLYNITKEGAKFTKNTIRLMPGVGDAFIILENALSIGKGVTNVAGSVVKNVETTATTGQQIAENVAQGISKVTNNSELPDTIEKLKSLQQKIQSKIGSAIQKSGNVVSKNIQNLTPAIKGGSKTKKSKYNKNSTKKQVRFK